MHRVLVPYQPPDDAQTFHTYYEEIHLPSAAELPGQRSLRYTFDVTAADGTSPYLAVAEAEFDDAESRVPRSHHQQANGCWPTLPATPPAEPSS